MKKNQIQKDKIDLILDLKRKGVSDINVLNEIEKTDRSIFIDNNLKRKSNLNIALPIDCGQTISQPLVVGIMTQHLEIKKNMRVLEIGTGSGYQSAILSKLARRVYTIERIKNLLIKAEKVFEDLKISNIVSKYADGNLGWKEQIPFDRIIITAATNQISNEISSQIHEGGIIVSPMVNNNKQIIMKYKKINNVLKSEVFDDVLFVPNLSGTE